MIRFHIHTRWMTWDDLGVDERIILKLIFKENERENVD
jgi:hypothetical protein